MTCMHFHVALIFGLVRILGVLSMVCDSTQKIEMIVAQLKIVEFVFLEDTIVRGSTTMVS